MRIDTVRRFSLAEIVLHRCNTVLYVTLACTDSLILVSRIEPVNILPNGASIDFR